MFTYLFSQIKALLITLALDQVAPPSVETTTSTLWLLNVDTDPVDDYMALYAAKERDKKLISIGIWKV